MKHQDAKFTEGSRIRLRPDIDPGFYGNWAVYGNEGTVAGIRQDRFGLPEIFVRWDKNHWTYNGVDDCWTYEDHFDLVEDNMSKDKKQVQRDALQALAQLFDLGEEEAPKQSKQKQGARLRNMFAEISDIGDDDSSHDEDDEFAQAVEAAGQKISESEAFVIVGVDRHDHPRAPEGILKPYALSFSKTPEGELLLTAHMAQLAARAHQDLAVQAIHQILSSDA